MNEVAEFKQANRATWATGDYDSIADLIWEVGGRCVQHAAVRSGEKVLDVACGTGNAAIPAAEAGADVVGVDLTPELFDAARRRAGEAGVEVDWVEGDAESLPFEDESFDVVLSTFGCMFTPSHERTAAEIARVLRAGGRLCLCNWTPEGGIGDFFRTVGAHAPPPPEFASPPPLWGTEDHVRDIFEGSGIDFEFERETVEFRFATVDEAVEMYGTRFGPVVMARKYLEGTNGDWTPLRDDLAGLFASHNTAAEGQGVLYPGEYLVVRGTKSG